ncbi:uncharacterized protein MYCFIDRAFT_172582 [Pseudocercospora fijiensis CIRAD86]|uniref:PHD-type domain-containing protein n=1 Tax=Pseudocercospora fijiensis (strain CIRAD86) TaxID=383855 RepID=M3AQJ9_PSEFD|nr:uncharacterized protein MYCFIDRAFT_172582 [Pseudocercospora fijiensis CIRAD86]EME86886.1 hypothetical protein MYCFIDRAFT_172582 [Pseudocercospora fijiensis CIRAD86]
MAQLGLKRFTAHHQSQACNATMASDDTQMDQAMAMTSQAAISIDLARKAAMPASSPNASTPRKNKRRAHADPEGAYTPSKRASLSKPMQTSTPRRRKGAGLSDTYAAKLDDSEDEDYKAPGNISRTPRATRRPRRGTRSSTRRTFGIAPDAGADSDVDPFISNSDSQRRMCVTNCNRWDEEEMLTCAGKACQEAERKFHIQCVGFRNMPWMLMNGDEGVKWYCFDCRRENGVGWKMNGIAVDGEELLV